MWFAVEKSMDNAGKKFPIVPFFVQNHALPVIMFKIVQT